MWSALEQKSWLVLVEKLAILFAQQGASVIGAPGKFKQNVQIDEGICHFLSSSALPSLTNYSGFMLWISTWISELFVLNYA